MALLGKVDLSKLESWPCLDTEALQDGFWFNRQGTRIRHNIFRFSMGYASDDILYTLPLTKERKKNIAQ